MNGAAGNARATDAFHAGPGYQFAVDQSLDGVARHAASLGGAAGGNTYAALSDRAGQMANQEYGNWQSRLAGLISPEFQATAGQAGYTGAQAPVYQDTAKQIVGVDQNTTKGINDQNTQSANAAMAGTNNTWGALMQAARLGTQLLGAAV